MANLARETCGVCGTDNTTQAVHALSVPDWPMKTCRAREVVSLTRAPDYRRPAANSRMRKLPRPKVTGATAPAPSSAEPATD